MDMPLFKMPQGPTKDLGVAIFSSIARIFSKKIND